MSDEFADRRLRTLDFLRAHGTESTPHIFGDLFAHLCGVESLVRSWGGSDLLALAALGHATYGTDGFAPHLLGVDERATLRDVIGRQAEALVYFYASCERDPFYRQLESPDTMVSDLVMLDRFSGAAIRPNAAQVRSFIDLTYANEVELAATSAGGPKEWTWLADFCIRTRRWASPEFFDGAAGVLTIGP